MNKILYTVNLNDYDHVRPVKAPGFRCVLFSDKEIQVPGWETIVIEPKEDIIRQTREIKINVHKFIDADVYVYMDANYELIGDLEYLVNKYFRRGWMAFKHSLRTCIYQEGKTVLAQGRDDRKIVDKQMADYFNAGFPAGYGLVENGIIIRSRELNDFCEDWYREIENHSYRDQLSFMYVAWRRKQPIQVIENHVKRRWFRLHSRKVSYRYSDEFRVWYFNPGRGDKNLGRAYNEHCALVPDDNDWICITDGDLMQINEFWPQQIEDIIKKHGKTYDLISCVTNRLGLRYQLPHGFSDDPNVLNHYKISREHYEKYYDEVIPSIQPTAGLLMLFPKRTWNRVKFGEGLTDVNGVFVDNAFSNGVLKKGGKIGIARGLYAFHYYRFHHENIRDYSHLK